MAGRVASERGLTCLSDITQQLEFLKAQGSILSTRGRAWVRFGGVHKSGRL